MSHSSSVGTGTPQGSNENHTPARRPQPRAIWLQLTRQLACRRGPALSRRV